MKVCPNCAAVLAEEVNVCSCGNTTFNPALFKKYGKVAKQCEKCNSWMAEGGECEECNKPKVGSMKVIEGKFTQGNEEVLEQFKESIQQASEAAEKGIQAFAIVCISGGNRAGYSYSCGEHFHTLLGALRCLDAELMRDVYLQQTDLEEE